MKLYSKISILGTGLFIFNLFFHSNFAQSYQLTSTSGTFTPLSSGTGVADLQVDNGFSDTIVIGFDFSFGGIPYTEIMASSDGYFYLVDDSFYEGKSSKGFFFDNSLEMMVYWGYAIIAPLWDDLNGDEGKATYKLEGILPNRIFTIEYLDWKWDHAATSAGISFQVKLYETSNKIAFVYRQEPGELNESSEYAGASIGLTVPFDCFYSLNNAGTAPSLSSTIETYDIFTKPASGQIYQFEYLAKPEATNHATSFNAGSYGISIDLGWIDAVGAVQPDGYLILASATNSFAEPLDSMDIVQDVDLSDNIGIVKVAQGIQTFNGFENARYNNTYYFKIYPYSNSGNIIDFKIDGDVPQVSTVCVPLQEPSNCVTDFEASTDGSNLFLNWVDATGTVIPDGYLLITSKTNSFTDPIDGNEIESDMDLSDGYGATKILKNINSFDGFINLETYETYYSRIYSYTNSGDFIDYKTDGTIPQNSVLVVKPEPTNHVTDFNALNDQGNIVISWVDAIGSTPADGYLILASNTNNIVNPVDNGEVEIDSSLSDGMGAVIISNGFQSFSGWLDINPATNYFFKIYPYTNSGIYINYNTTPEIPQILYTPPVNFVEQTSIALEGAGWGTVEWGDYDQDGYLDILRTGRSPENSYRTVVYRNNGDNSFTEQSAIDLVQITNGTAVWGDYNNDGYLDIMLSGSYSSGWISKIYSNNTNGTFSEQTGISLTEAQYSCAAWGDYNNDGKLDILYSGSANPYAVTKLYRNNGDSTFTEQTAMPFTGYLSSIDWGDYNSDGYLDVLTTGGDGSGNWVTRLYRNNGNNTFTEQTNTSLLNVQGSGKWGDYNNDGYLDIVLSGLDGISGYSVSSKIFKNNGDGTFTAQNDISIGGVYYGSLAWGDYNNDGFLDLIVTGDPYWDQPKGSKIYRNKGDGTFTEETGISLQNASGTAVAWTDYDNDMDLDVLITGESNEVGFAKIYRNDGFVKNTAPIAPTNINEEVYGRSVRLSWDKSNDAATDQAGLSYNIYVGTSTDNHAVWAPYADTTNGFRIVTKRGAIQTNSLTINNLEGGTYYWSVQAIDAGFMGSEFASPSSFSIIHFNSISPIADQSLILGETGIALTVTESLTPDSRIWKYGFAPGGPYDSIIDEETSNIYHPNFAESGPHFVVCISKYGTVEVTSNEVKIDVRYFTELPNTSFYDAAEGNITWADLNNDNFLDIFLSGTNRPNSSWEPDAVTKLYFNNGDGTFTEQPGISITGVFESSIACGDYDSDGFLDILLTGATDNYNSSGITKIYRNNGDSTFTELTEVALKGVHKGSAAWVDYDNDGDLDIFISGVGVDGGALFCTYQNNENEFAEVTLNIVPFTDGNLDLGDFNKDGFIDLITCGYDYSGNRMTRIYTNNGNGSFTLLPIDNLTGMNGGSVALGDYDNDSYIDILMVGSKDGWSESTLVYHNNGDNTFTEQTNIPLIGVIHNSIAWFDFDNDGYLDIVITGSTDDWSSGAVSKVYRNNGNNTFTEQTRVTIPSLYKSSVRHGDYDNDGDLDLFLLGKLSSDESYARIYRNNSITTNNIPSIPTNLNAQIIEGNVRLSWDKATDTETSENGITYNIVIASLPDSTILKSPLGDLATGHLKVVSTGNVGSPTAYLIKGLSIGEYIWAVQSIDKTNLSSGFSEWSNFEILPQYTEKQSLDVYLENLYLDWVDYNSDGTLDIYLTGTVWSNSVVSKIYKNQADTAFEQDTNITLPGVCTANSGGSILEDYENLNYNAGVAWGDYNNDGFLDVILAGDTDAYNHTTITKLYSNNGDGSFTEQTKATFPTFSYGSSIAWGDYNNDGLQDILIGGLQTSGNGTNATKLFQNNGDSTFTELTDFYFGYSIMGSVTWADYDNDGYLDALVCGSNYTNLFHNNGEGGLEKQTSISFTGVINSSAAWADYNNDGYLDFVICGMDNDYNRITKIYKNNGNNSFTDINAFIRGVIGGSIAWGDYDNDGDSDLLMSGKSGNVVTIIYRNDGNDVFTELDYGLDQVVKGYSSFGDFDDDGDLDIVSGGRTILYSNSGSASYHIGVEIYENNGDYINSAPTAPLNLKIDRIEDNYRFMWDAATDDKTPATSLSYNLRIGSNPGGRDILSPLSKTDTTNLSILALGNCQLSKSKIIQSLKPGTYYWSVQAVDQTFKAGQWAQEQTLVVSPIVADFIADTVCLGSGTTFADISITANESIISWEWQFGDDSVSNITNPTHIYKSAGTYLVTLIINSQSYQSSATKEIVVKPRPIADFTALPVCFGSATIFTNTSTIPQDLTITSWNWDFGDGLSNSTPATENPGEHMYINTGTFEANLIITGNNGCNDSISKGVEVVPQPNANIYISSGSEFSFCKNSGDSAYLYVNSQQNCTYQWLLNEVPIGGFTQNAITVKDNGGNFKARVTNELGGCSLSTESPIVITVNEAPSNPAIDYNAQGNIFCTGDSLILETSAIPNLNYLWKRDGGLVGQETSYVVKQSGVYTLTVQNSENGCEAISGDVVEVNVNAVPAINNLIYGETEFCEGGDVIFTVTNNPQYNYQWMDGKIAIEGETTNQYVATQAGSYWLQIANSSLCTTETSPVEVTVNPNPSVPTIEANGPIIFCEGNNVVLSIPAVEGATYDWYKNGVEQDVKSNSILATDSGAYNLKITNTFGCYVYSSDNVNVTVHPIPEVSALSKDGVTTFCEGGRVGLSLTIQNPDLYSFNWYLRNTDTLLIAKDTTSLEADRNGYYWLEVGNSGCLAKTPEVNVTVNPMPTTPVIEASSASVTICQGEPLSLSIIPTNGESYQWFRNSVAMDGETNDTVSIIETGVYNVVSSIGSCIQTSEPVSVKVNDLPQEIDFSYSSTELIFCSDKTLTITAQGNPVIYKYQWMRADGTFIDGATSNSITVNETGGYLVNVTNPNGCQRVSEVAEITVKLTPDVPVIQVKDNLSSFCEGLQTTLFASMSDVSYLWHKVNDSQFSYTNDSLVIDELSESGTYYLVVTSNNNCQSTSANKTITVFEAPAKYDPTAGGAVNFCEGGSVTLKTNYNTADLTQYNLQWLNQGNPIEGATDKNYTATASGNYFLEVVNKVNGCSVSTSSIEVVVDKKPDTPVIKEETNTTNFCPGTEVKLFVDNFSSEFEYQWSRSGIEIDGATQSVYGGKLTGGEYSVEVASGTCNAQSPQYSLTEKEAPDKPDIYARGPNIWILACSNQSAIGYRWYYNGSLITGATEYMYIANQNLGDYYVEINEGGECWTMSDIIDIPSGEITGVDELIDETVSVFPNPSEGIFTISLGNYFPGTIHVTITNEIGNALKIQEFTDVNGFEMELPELPHGIYFGKIEYQGKVVMKKLVRN
jgi:hypothetical protein